MQVSYDGLVIFLPWPPHSFLAIINCLKPVSRWLMYTDKKLSKKNLIVSCLFYLPTKNSMVEKVRKREMQKNGKFMNYHISATFCLKHGCKSVKIDECSANCITFYILHQLCKIQWLLYAVCLSGESFTESFMFLAQTVYFWECF